MKTMLPLLLSVIPAIAFISCNGQETGSSGNNPDSAGHHSVYETGKHPTPSALEKLVEEGFDPYFISSADTVSKYGPDCIVRDVLCDSKNNVWLASWQGIIQYNGHVFTNLTLQQNLIHFHVLSCFEDSKGNLWFGMARGGVYRYDGTAFQLFNKKDGMADYNVMTIAEDALGTIWMGTDSGATSYDGKMFTNYSNVNGLTCGKVNSICRDKSGNLWFGGETGVTIYDGKSFREFTNEKQQAFERVTGIHEDKNGNMWIGWMQGLYVYNGTSFSEPISGYLTYYIVSDHEGNVWYSHSDPNMKYDNVPRQALWFSDGEHHYKADEHGEPNDFQIFGKSADTADNIWYGTMHGLQKYDGEKTISFTQ